MGTQAEENGKLQGLLADLPALRERAAVAAQRLSDLKATRDLMQRRLSQYTKFNQQLLVSLKNPGNKGHAGNDLSLDSQLMPIQTESKPGLLSQELTQGTQGDCPGFFYGTGLRQKRPSNSWTGPRANAEWEREAGSLNRASSPKLQRKASLNSVPESLSQAKSVWSSSHEPSPSRSMPTQRLSRFFPHQDSNQQLSPTSDGHVRVTASRPSGLRTSQSYCSPVGSMVTHAPPNSGRNSPMRGGYPQHELEQRRPLSSVKQHSMRMSELRKDTLSHTNSCPSQTYGQGELSPHSSQFDQQMASLETMLCSDSLTQNGSQSLHTCNASSGNATPRHMNMRNTAEAVSSLGTNLLRSSAPQSGTNSWPCVTSPRSSTADYSFRNFTDSQVKSSWNNNNNNASSAYSPVFDGEPATQPRFRSAPGSAGHAAQCEANHLTRSHSASQCPPTHAFTDTQKPQIQVPQQQRGQNESSFWTFYDPSAMISSFGPSDRAMTASGFMELSESLEQLHHTDGPQNEDAHAKSCMTSGIRRAIQVKRSPRGSMESADRMLMHKGWSSEGGGYGAHSGGVATPARSNAATAPSTIQPDDDDFERSPWGKSACEFLSADMEGDMESSGHAHDQTLGEDMLAEVNLGFDVFLDTFS